MTINTCLVNLNRLIRFDKDFKHTKTAVLEISLILLKEEIYLLCVIFLSGTENGVSRRHIVIDL